MWFSVFLTSSYFLGIKVGKGLNAHLCVIGGMEPSENFEIILYVIDEWNQKLVELIIIERLDCFKSTLVSSEIF